MSESIYAALDKNSEMFYKALKYGRVRGVAALVPPEGAESSRAAILSKTARELVERDIMVALPGVLAGELKAEGLTAEQLSRGAGYGVAELCGYLGIEPVVFLDAQNPDTRPLDPFETLGRHANRDLTDLPLAAFPFGDDPLSNADTIDEALHQKRLGIEWCDRFYCRPDSFS